MKIAFLYSAYTDPQHLKRLIDVLPEGSESFVHIDAKSDISQFKAVVNGEHIHYLEQRYNVAVCLDQGMIYNDILAETGASSATISRVNRSLQYGRGGYEIAFARMNGTEDEKE